MKEQKHFTSSLVDTIIDYLPGLICFMLFGFLSILLILATPSCTQAPRVSHNISQDADNFNIVRRLTVINCRSDKVTLQLTGTFSIYKNTTTNELEVTCELPDGKYTKHFIYLNDWVCYTVEDISGTHVDKYSYELNFMPEQIPGVKITNKD